MIMQISQSFYAAGGASQLLFARIDARRFASIYSAKGRWGLLDHMLSTSASDPSLAAVTLDINSGSTVPAATFRSAMSDGTSSSKVPTSLDLMQVKEAVRRAAADVLGRDLDGKCLLALRLCRCLLGLKHCTNCPIAPASCAVRPSWCASGSNDLTAGGFDSLSAVELSSTLSTALGVQLPGTLAFDYPSTSSMAQYIFSLLQPSQNGVESAVAAPSAMLVSVHRQDQPEPNGGSLVSLQMCARLPAGYTDASGRAVAGGADNIRLVPFDRWDLESLRVRGRARGS